MAIVSYPGVYVEEVPSGVHPIATASTSIPAFVGTAEMGPIDEAKLITNWTAFQRFYGGFVAGGAPNNYLAHSVYQFFNNGGSQCYIARVIKNAAVAASVTVNDGLVVGITDATVKLKATTFSAKTPGVWGNSLVLEVEKGTNNPDTDLKISIKLYKGTVDLTQAASLTGEALTNFEDELQKIAPLETFDNLNVSDPEASNYIVTVLANKSNLITANVDENASAPSDPTTINEVEIVTGFTGGTNGTAPEVTDYRATMESQLNSITDISLLATPGVGSKEMFGSAVAYCENRHLQDIFYIGEAPATITEPADARTFRESLTKPNSFGAVYFPWIKALDISGQSSEPILLPPSGFIAGLYGRIDGKRGVWKAPAGTEATISGAVGLTKNLTDVEQGQLNIDKYNVNCIRRFAASGIVSWGARTITPPGSEYKYVPVRRMAIMLRVSIYNGIQWAVFEPNDEELWGQLRLNIGSFMMTLFRQGAFQGASPTKAFFVKCDSETTSQNEINLGIVNVLVGFAPLKPAEFVVVKISQIAGQSS